MKLFHYSFDSSKKILELLVAFLKRFVNKVYAKIKATNFLCSNVKSDRSIKKYIHTVYYFLITKK